MALSSTLGEEYLASQYFMRRLAEARQAEQMTASMQFDLARSPLSDDELEKIVDAFRDTPRRRTGWGLSEQLNEILSREPKRIPVSDVQKLQRNLISQGYAPPDAAANGVWDPTWYAYFRRWDRDNLEKQRSGHHWYSAPVEAGARAITNTLPSRVFQAIVGGARGLAQQAPETAERVGLAGGAVGGAAIGAAAGSVLPGVGTALGAVGGAAIGGAIGFLADLFGEDEGEEDQSGLARLVDALTPYEEYRDKPKAFFEDLGFVLTASSMIAGAGVGVRGAVTGVRAIQAARVPVPAPAVAAEAATGSAFGGVPRLMNAVRAQRAVSAARPVPLGQVLLAPGPGSQLGVFGTVVRAATRRFAPGTVAALEQTMLRYSPIAFAHRLGPNVVLKAFAGASQASMGARLFSGIGQGSKQRLEEMKTALEAELGRDLREDELDELRKRAAVGTIEKAIAEAPELKTGVNVPFFGDIVDLAGFVLYPERLLPFSGTRIARSSVRVMGDTSLAPYAHAAQYNDPKLGLKEAVAWVKEWLTPVDNAWLRADYGIHREAWEIINRARISPGVAFRKNSYAVARAQVIRTVRKEFDQAGRSETLERLMARSFTDPTDFEAWLIGLGGQGRGIERLQAWKRANELTRKVQREIREGQLVPLADEKGAMLLAESRLREEIPLAGRKGAMVGEKTIKTTRARPNDPFKVDRMTIEAQIERLQTRVQKYRSTARRGTTSPHVTILLNEQARLAETEIEILTARLAQLQPGKEVKDLTIRFVPARLEFADRGTMLGKAREFKDLRKAVLDTEDNPAAHAVARQQLANFVDELAAEGFIPDELARKAKVGRPSDRVGQLLEDRAEQAAPILQLPRQYMDEYASLGYKPVETGEDVLFPDELEKLIEVGGIGDYTRRAQVWETLGFSPRWRSDRSIFRLRHEAEIAELEQVFREEGIVLNGEQAMRRLHDWLVAINHDGAVLGPLTKPKQGRPRLYKVDVRDLSAEDVLRAFEDVPGFTDDTALKVFGALRRGAVYGGEVKLLHPADSLRVIGRAMRINGLPGFSDAMRTWHAEVPMRLSRRAWNTDEFVYRPSADVARSPHRTRVETELRTVANRTQISDRQRQFGMMMLDSLARSQVRAGRFATADDFYRHLDVGFAQRYVEGDTTPTLFKTALKGPSAKRLERMLRDFEDSKEWYETSAGTFVDIFGPMGRVQLRDGRDVETLDLMTQLVAATSPRKDPDQNWRIALDVLNDYLDGRPVRGVTPNVKGMVEDILNGRTIDRWDEPFRTPVSNQRRLKAWNFYNNLRGELDKVTVDTWMARLWGIESPTAVQYREIESQIRQIAENVGWYPAQVQAALWAGVKDEAANAVMREYRALVRSGGKRSARGRTANQLLAEAKRLRDARSFADLANDPKIASRIDALQGRLPALLQQVENEVLGMTQFGPGLQTVMRFFRNADFSTLVHENAHLLRRLLPEEDVRILEGVYGVRRFPGQDFTPVPLTGIRGKQGKAALEELRERTIDLDTPGRGGAIFDPHKGIFVSGRGYAVATQTGTSAKLEAARAASDPAYFERELKKFIEANRRELENPRAHVGTWNDREGTIHLDVSEIVEDLDEAKALGAAREQEAIFDLGKLEDIPIEREAVFQGGWSRDAEERFALDAEQFFLQKVEPEKAGGSWRALRAALHSLWANSRPTAVELNLVPRETRLVLDKHFGEALAEIPAAGIGPFLKSAASKQVVGGAALGAATGAATGDEGLADVVKGAVGGAVAGAVARGALKRTYGYLPDALVRLNTALRYTLSFTFDAGRYSEQNLIAMSKYNLPPMLAPVKYVKSREWARSPFTNGPVRGDKAWRDAIRFWDEINGTTWFQNIDDIDRRLYQAGILGFSPRNWEIAQAWQLYQRGWGAEKIAEAIPTIGRYGLGRTAAEKSANFIFFPFSFSKKLLLTLGDFFLQAPVRALLLHEGMRRYYESEFDDKLKDFLDRRAPLLKELALVNNLVFGISPGRFFLQGLTDHRTNLGKAMQLIASFFVPSGAATPLAQAAGGAGDLAIHAFSPIVVTGESLDRAGGIDGLDDILRRYVPFVRELDGYFLKDNAAFPSQLVALTEGAEPFYQLSKYMDEVRAAKAEYEPFAVAMGYSSVDGLLQSDAGLPIRAALEEQRAAIANEYPTGFRMAQSLENRDALIDHSLRELANKPNRSEAEDRILGLAEEVERYQLLKDMLGLDPQIVDMLAAHDIRQKATQWAGDRRFAELYDMLFARNYGPIRRVA